MNKYTSPQAYLNRFFKGDKRFQYTTLEDGSDVYTSKDFQLVWVRNEDFVLEIRIQDFDTGADYFEECFYGSLTDCVYKIKNINKNSFLK